MKALIYRGSHVLEFSDAADPVPQPDEVLVAVEAVGICGSDMHAWHGHDERRPAPLILGHEAAGRIVTGPRKQRSTTASNRRRRMSLSLKRPWRSREKVE